MPSVILYVGFRTSGFADLYLYTFRDTTDNLHLLASLSRMCSFMESGMLHKRQ